MQEDDSIKIQLYTRMLQELEDMSGTCSSGFAARIVNIISGYDNFNIRMSFNDQIIANFTGRLNAAARKITLEDSIFRTTKLEDVVELWLLSEDRNDLRSDIESKLENRLKIRDIVTFFLSESREEKIEECVSHFKEAVLNEMSVKSSKHSERRNFSLFFRSHVSFIREELAEEFKEFVTETDFDLSFRKAIMFYEA